MKKLILLAVSTFLLLAVQAQSPECSKVKDGVFTATIEVEGEENVTLITRKGNKQIEENKKKGIKMEFVVKWTSECTYELSKPKVIKGNFPGVEDKQVLFVKITDVQKEFYNADVSSNFFDGVMSSEFVIVK